MTDQHIRPNSLLAKCPVLEEMIRTGYTFTSNNERIPMHANINATYATALYETILQVKPNAAVEVGMAFGVSSLSILTALKELGRGKLVSIDPYQIKGKSWGGGGGLKAVKRAGLETFHGFVEKQSHAALSNMVEKGDKIDFAYIDGSHFVEDVLIDFTLIDKMLVVGGVVGFNDCWMPAVHKVIKFMKRHREYEEMSVDWRGIDSDYSRRAEVKTFLSNNIPLLGDTFRQNQDRYFKKTDEVKHKWTFFKDF